MREVIVFLQLYLLYLIGEERNRYALLVSVFARNGMVWEKRKSVT